MVVDTMSPPQHQPIQPRIKREGFEIPPSPAASNTNNLLNLSSPSPAPNLPNYGTHSRSSSQSQNNWSALRHTPGANLSHNSTSTSNSTSNSGTINPAQFLQSQGQGQRPRMSGGQGQGQGRNDSHNGNNDLMDMTMLSSGLTSPTEAHEQMFKAFAGDQNMGISNARMNVDSTETSMENSPLSMGEAEGGHGGGMQDQRGFTNAGWDGQNGEGQNGQERSGGNMGNNGVSLLDTFAKSQYPTMGYGGTSASASASARFDDDDLLALMSSHNFDANGFANNNGAGSSQQHGAAFFSALQNPPQGHTQEDFRLLEAINQNFGMSEIPAHTNDQPGPSGSSYVHVESATSGFSHLHGQQYANSAPAAFDHPHGAQYHSGHANQDWGNNAGAGGYSYQPQTGHGGSGQMGQHAMGQGMVFGGMPIHSQFMHRQMTNETPSLVDPSSGSFSSFAEDASIFSSIMGGKWPNAREPPYEHSAMRHSSGTGSGEMGTPATVLSGMSLEGGQSGSTRSPVSVGGEDVVIIAGDDVEMRDGREEMAVGAKVPARGRGRSSNKAAVDANGKPKAARRNSSVTAAAGGSGTREQAAAQGGVGKAPRAVSKTRPGHRRTGSSATRNSAGANPAAVGIESASTLTSNRIDPSNFQHYLLPSLDGNVFRRPSLGRKFSDSVTMSADRPTIDLPAVQDYVSPGGRRGSGVRLAAGPDSSKLRRYSMDDAVSSSGRPDVKNLAPNNDLMATVDEAAIEDGEDDSPTVLSAEDLAKARISRRRLSHNEVERKRRETINEKIQELETLLPPNVVASAIAARDVESIKEEDEDEAAEAKAESGKGKKGKSRNRKVIKKSTVPDKLCKGTVLCLTVDLVKQMQEMLNLKTAREQQLMQEIQRLQGQLDPSGQSVHQYTNRTDPFSGMGDMGVEDLRSVNDFDLQGLGSHVMEEGGSSTKSRHPDEHHAGINTDEEAQRLLDGEINY